MLVHFECRMEISYEQFVVRSACVPEQSCCTNYVKQNHVQDLAVGGSSLCKHEDQHIL